MVRVGHFLFFVLELYTYDLMSWKVSLIRDMVEKGFDCVVDNNTVIMLFRKSPEAILTTIKLRKKNGNFVLKWKNTQLRARYCKLKIGNFQAEKLIHFEKVYL